MAPPANTNADQGFIQYASARRQERLQQQQDLVDLILRGPEPVDDVGLSVQTATACSPPRCCARSPLASGKTRQS